MIGRGAAYDYPLASSLWWRAAAGARVRVGIARRRWDVDVRQPAAEAVEGTVWFRADRRVARSPPPVVRAPHRRRRRWRQRIVRVGERPRVDEPAPRGGGAARTLYPA